MRKEEKLLFFAGWKDILNGDFVWSILHEPAFGLKCLCGMTAISLIGLANLMFVPAAERERRF